MAEPTDDSYTVGWICVLPKELAAALNMLDKKYPKRFGHEHDQNIYTPGKIGPHNVVIAALPAGWKGNNPAVMVATRMMARFPKIRIGLLVGIGGGLPHKGNDIRLGDVVVSKPDGKFGGVVEYDMGTYTNGRFVRTGTLNTPPEKLLSMLQYMPLHGDCFGECPSKYPGEDLDQLHEYDVDGERLITRDSGNRENGPHVFYGTIASGNSVIKDASKRNELIKKYGVLCCEMEAAGLMNNPFPCLIIRGISDYADSYKNDEWQNYAATTAARYAKDFLNEFPNDDVRKLEPMKINSEQMYSVVQSRLSS